jgi:uncharacterized membrane protein
MGAMDKFKEILVETVTNYPARMIGALLGFLVGLLIILLGLKEVLIIAIFVLAGFFIGKLRERR